MASSININGTWKKISKVFTNVNGTWRQVKKAYSNVNGAWRQWYSGSENKLVRYGSISSGGSMVNKFTLVDVNTLADISSKEYPRTFDICGANSSKIFSITSSPNAQTGALGTIDEIDPDTHVVLRTGKYGDGGTWGKYRNYYINNIDANDQNIIINGFYTGRNENENTTYTTVVWRLDANTMANLGMFSYNVSGINTQRNYGYGALIGNNIYMYHHTSVNDLTLHVADINSHTGGYYMSSYWGGVAYPSGSRGWATLNSATATNAYTYVIGRERLMSSEGSYESTYLTKLSGGVVISQRNLGNSYSGWDKCSKLFAMKEE